MAKRKLVVIGNGMAGVRCVEEILKVDPDAFDVTIIGKENHPNYNRILLSKVLQGDTSVQDIVLNDLDWYQANGIRLIRNETAAAIDTSRQIVVTRQGLVVDYDELILATGSLPFMLPLPGANKPGVTAFRNIADCERMVETARTHSKAVVIGGGLLGLEAARGLLNLGMQVDIVHIFGSIMERQLDATASRMLQDELEAQGMRFLLEKHSEEIIGRSRAVGLKFKDGTKTDADLIVMAVGVRPNVQLAKDGGIETNRAIVVDDYMRTSVPNVYAVGECAEHRGTVYGLVAPLYEQGKVLAQAICGRETAGYQGSVLATQLKVSGVDVFSAGVFADSDEVQSIKQYDGIRKTYKKIVVRDGKIVGAVLFGNIAESSRLLGLIRRQSSYAEYERETAAAGGEPETVASRAAAMSDSELVCSCNGVSKGAIVQAIRENNLQSVDDIKRCTKASGSCGGCRPMVGSLLDLVQGGGAGGRKREPICACTTATHEELGAAGREGKYRHPLEAIRIFGWATETGCAACRPALRYYAEVHGDAPANWPEGFDAEQGAAAAAGVERMEDGTFAVAPPIPGGVCEPAFLRAVADAAEANGVPLVKLYPGPRLVLYGVERQRLEPVLRDLGMSGSTGGGHYVREVATDAGMPYERDAVRDSVGIGAMLADALQGIALPAGLSIGVSSSPRHLAESLVKEIGIVGTPAGWELYAGGAGGGKPASGKLVCTAETAEELLEMTRSFIQLYRETGEFNEPLGAWLKRAGMLPLREYLYDGEARRSLTSRLEKARTGQSLMGRRAPAGVN